jgi:hypothetical protein
MTKKETEGKVGQAGKKGQKETKTARVGGPAVCGGGGGGMMVFCAGRGCVGL